MDIIPFIKAQIDADKPKASDVALQYAVDEILKLRAAGRKVVDALSNSGYDNLDELKDAIGELEDLVGRS